MPKGRDSRDKTRSGANLGFEAKLWLAADRLRGHIDAPSF